MLSEKEIKRIFVEVASDNGYQDEFYLYNLGFKNPLIRGERYDDLMTMIRLFAEVKTKELKSTISYFIDEAITEWTKGFTTPFDFIREETIKAGRLRRMVMENE